MIVDALKKWRVRSVSKYSVRILLVSDSACQGALYIKAICENKHVLNANLSCRVTPRYFDKPQIPVVWQRYGFRSN